jgi:hypothetical protein
MMRKSYPGISTSLSNNFESSLSQEFIACE